MTKQPSIRKLKRESEVCIGHPRLIKTARLAKNPDVAFRAALEGGFPETLAEGCRSLAIIKKRYGKIIFEEILREIKRGLPVERIFAYLSPFIQTAYWLNFLNNKTHFGDKKNIVIPCNDFAHVAVITTLLSCIPRLDHQEQEEVLLKISDNRAISLLYVQEARNFIKNACKQNPINNDCIVRTHRFLRAYVQVVGVKAGIEDTYLNCANKVREYILSSARS